jgi:WD40 repeat protein
VALSRLFVSHSSKDNIAAIAFKQWLCGSGWSGEDIFLDLDDIGAGERWKDALRKAHVRCEAVVLLASPEALASPECLTEVRKAEDFGKEIIVVLLRDLTVDDQRLGSYKERQIVDLSQPPQSHTEIINYRGDQHQVTFNDEALAKIKEYLVRRGITPESFSWPPIGKPDAEPFPGLNAFTEDDAAIFFGRDADILACLDEFRLLRRNATSRVLAIQAASGAGKSSFLRAGLWPRLARDPDFAPLAMLRPAHGILTGPEGVGQKLAKRLSRPGVPVNPGEIYARLMADDVATAVGKFLELMKKTAALEFEQRRIGNPNAIPPVLIFAVDQAEELLAADNQAENQRFLALMAALLHEPPPGVELFAILTVRTDNATHLYQALADRNLEAPKIFSMLPMPRTSYRDVIVKPIEVVARQGAKITIAPALTEQLVADAAGADALPLLAFTLFQLYRGFSAGGSITLEHYGLIGGIAGSIKAAIKEALSRPEDAPEIPTDGEQQLASLKATFVPWLARIDPASGQPARRTARLEEFTGAARAMAERLVQKRLLVADFRGGANIVEVAHESLLRQWAPLEAWLRAEADDLRIAGAVESAAGEWVRNGRASTWLDHRGERLAAAEAVAAKEDYRRRLGKEGIAYLEDCREREESQARTRRRMVQLVRWSIATAILLVVGMTFASYRSYKNQQAALRAQKEAEVSLLMGQAQTNLRSNSANVDRALDQALRAYEMIASTASRSALLQVLLEMSPHAKAVLAIGANAQSLAWTSGDHLNVAMATRMQTFDVGKPQQRPAISDLPNIERAQEGNRSVISMLAPIGAGQMIAVFNEGSIWLLRDGAGKAQVQAAKGDVSIGPSPHAVSIAPSGSVIAVATVDARVVLYRCDWQAATPACKPQQLGDVHGDVVAVNNHEDRIAVGDRAGRVTVYSLAGEIVAEAAPFGAGVVSLGWAPQRDWLAVGTLQGDVGVFDFSGGSASKIIQQSFGANPVTALQWSPKDVALAFVCQGKTVCVWQSKAEGDARGTFKPVARFEGHDQSITRLSFDPAGVALASGAADGTVRIWTLAQNTDITFEIYPDEGLEISSVAVSPDGKWVAGGSSDGTIQLWDAANKISKAAVQPSKDFEVRALSWNHQDILAAIHDNATISIVPAAAPQTAINFPLESHSGYHLAWADDDRLIAVPTGETGVLLVDPKNPRAKPLLLNRTDGSDEAWGVASMAGERSLIVSYAGGAIHIWNLSSKQEIAVQPADLGTSDKIGVGSISVSPDRRLLATSSGGQFVPIYDVAKRMPLRVLKTESPEISTVAFSITGNKLAALGSDSWLYVWTMDKDQPELFLTLPVIPRRTVVGSATSRSDHALWFDWVSDDCIVIASGIAALSGVCTDPDKWRGRINALAPAFGGSIK